MLRKVLIAVGVLIGGFVVLVALQPSTFTVTRAATIAAPAAAVFAQVNDLRNWQNWSPWAKLDPAMKVSFEGAPAGQGAIHSWAGNSEVGEGRMTVTESQSAERVRLKLEFLKPFESTNTAEFTFKPEAAGTLVTWSMRGESNFIQKAFCLIMNGEKMVGQDFEKGLAQMKAYIEAEVKK